MADNAYVREELLALTTELNQLAQRVQNGEVLDIKPIQDRVTQLCQQSVGLPKPVDPYILQGMQVLMTNLDQLGQAIRFHQSQLQERMTGQSVRRKATTAYGLPPTVAPKKR